MIEIEDPSQPIGIASLVKFSENNLLDANLDLNKYMKIDDQEGRNPVRKQESQRLSPLEENDKKEMDEDFNQEKSDKRFLNDKFRRIKLLDCSN